MALYEILEDGTIRKIAGNLAYRAGSGVNIVDGVISTVSSSDSQTLLYGTEQATSGITSGTVTLGDITPYKFIVFVSGQGSYKTINTYNVKSLTNGELGLYGYASQYINITISGSLTAFKITLISAGSQSLWRIWGVK